MSRAAAMPEKPGQAAVGQVLAAVRSTALALLLLAVLYAVARGSAPGLILLSLLGGLLSAGMEAASRGTSGTPRARWCPGCAASLKSRWSRLGPWSLSGLGIGWFLAAVLLLAAAALGEDCGAAGRWLGVAYVAIAPGAVVLVAAQLRPRRWPCLSCLAVQGVVIAAAATALNAGLPAIGPELWSLYPYAALHALLLALILGWFVPGLEAGFHLRFLERQLGSVLATPLGSLALAAGGPVQQIASDNGAWCWGAPTAPVRIDAWVHPLCESCGPTIDRLLELAERRPETVRLVLRVAPRQGDGGLAAALTAIGLAAGRQAGLRAFRAIEGDRARRPRRDPSPEVAAANLLSSQPDLDRTFLARAEAELAGWERACGDAVLGLPAVFVGGRLFAAPIVHLEAVLDLHPGLVEAVLSSR